MSSSPAMPSVLGEAVAGSPGVARESLAFEAAEGQVDWGGQDERLAGGWGWGGTDLAQEHGEAVGRTGLCPLKRPLPRP